MNYETLLHNLLERDERYLVLTAENRAAIRNLPAKIGNRFIDVGIAEQTMIGAAAGLALRGRVPITHALAAFLTMRAFEFIRTDVGISGLPVKLVGGVAGFLSEANGPTHQAIEDVSIMRGIPPMGVFCPADEEDMLIGLEQILESSQPFYIRYTNLPPAVTHSRDFAISEAELISEGSDVCILVYGTLLREAISAASILAEHGISTRILNMRTLKPIDSDAILGSVNWCELTVTLEDHFLIGGLYSIVAEVLLKHKITADVLPIALENRWFKPALLPDVLEYEGFTGRAIAMKIIHELQK